MTTSIIGEVSKAASFGTSIARTLPSTVVAGDLLLGIAAYGFSGGVTAPTGFALQETRTNDAAHCQVSFATKKAVSSDANSVVTFGMPDISSTNRALIIVMVLRSPTAGQTPSIKQIVWGSAGTATTTTTPATPGITPAATGSLLLEGASAHNGNNSFTLPAALTLAATETTASGAGPRTTVASRSDTTAGTPVGGSTLTATVADEYTMFSLEVLDTTPARTAQMRQSGLWVAKNAFIRQSGAWV